jgi:hypothetical protein
MHCSSLTSVARVFGDQKAWQRLSLARGCGAWRGAAVLWGQRGGNNIRLPALVVDRLGNSSLCEM